ncbi:hypothetical protein R1sor_006158 [Riccia sorocarpa]|uniref:Uncharacterized protein n=1 Tax=Riccia sorocarpa TaxID=122646 RepID=A0ABD3HLU5_9MARC
MRRAAIRLGTTDAFEKAFDFAIRCTGPVANIPHIISVRGRLSFDFKPPQHAVTEPGESSRPPISAVTAVTILSSSTDDSAEPKRQNDVADSQPVQRNLEVPVYTFITSLSSNDEPVEIPLQHDHPHFSIPEPEIVGPAEPEFEIPEEPCFAVPPEPEFEAPGAPYFAVPADPEIACPEPYIADPDEPEVVVLGVTPRRRPNTRASMTRQREHINEVMQHG